VTPFLFSFAILLSAQTSAEFWPGTQYDPSIPTEKAVIGHDPGERISSHAEIVKYMETLASAVPSRIKVFEYGRTWEGRRLIYAVIGSQENIGRLDEIQKSMAELADPRITHEAGAKTLEANLPALAWLAYGVHGNEISSPDAALFTAYHLLAARNSDLVASILKNDLILIDPLENPDGRDRFVHNFNVAEGLAPDPNQLAAEHNEPWPGGRTNHYYFDMNRDWFAMTQPETRGRIAAVRQWLPLVFVDLHEMGSDSTYYFAPEAYPFNPYITTKQKESLEWFGKNNSRYFDQLGFSYFTKEGYDEFYPGYGASWPLFYGAIGMTYEQASTRGLIVKKSDGTIVTFRDTVQKHFITSISTLETVAIHRHQLLADFYAYRKEAVSEGLHGPVREYILPREGNVSEVDKLAHHLHDQGVEVKQALAPFAGGTRNFPKGSYVVPLAQPSYRLIRALLDPQVSMTPDFLAAEEHRRQTRQPSQMYDVTAWSLPLQYGVSAIASPAECQGDFEDLPPDVPPAIVPSSAPELAYLVPWGRSASGRFLAAALRHGLRVASTDRTFVQNGQQFPAGTLIIKVKENGPGLAETVGKIAKATSADVYGTATGWMDEGPNFGSRYVTYVPADLNIAIAWDRPTLASSAGAARYVMEREFGYPVTAIRTQQLASGDLSSFKTIILPDTGGSETYDGVLGANGTRHLRDWLEAGGTLVALGPGAVNYLSHPHVEMLAVNEEESIEQAEPKSKPETAASATRGSEAAAESSSSDRKPGKLISSEAEFQKAITPDAELPDSLHGVLLRAKVNGESWLTAGLPETVNVLVTGRAIFTPIKQDKGLNAAYYEAPDRILASGFMWESNRKQLAYKPFLVLQRVGRGNVIAFTSDPTFRGYMDGLNLLLLNAVFRGPSHAVPAGASFGEQSR
jgi:hypothetical protein